MKSPNNTVAGSLAFSTLYRTGGWAALIAAILFRRNLDAEYMLLKAAGILPGGAVAAPDSITGWFELLAKSPLTGLTLLQVFDLANYALVGVMFIALAAALWHNSPSLSLLAAASTITSVAAFFAGSQAFSLLALSRRYAAAASQAQRQALEAAGQALLTLHNNNSYQGSGLYLSFLLIAAAGLLLAVAMLHSPQFGRCSALMGILANVSGLSYYVFLALAPQLTFLPISVSAVFLLVWYIQAGCRLLRLSKLCEQIDAEAV